MIGQALRQVFSKGSYVLLAAATAVAVFILATWLPNLGLIWQITVSESVPLADKLNILTSLIGSIGTNFTIVSGLTAISIAALFGLNMALVVYLFRSRPAGHGIAVASLGGLASGLLGIGCAACGTLVLGPVLSFAGAGTIIAMLPFGGEEFGMLGVGMLGLSLVLSAREIARPITCQVSRTGGR